MVPTRTRQTRLDLTPLTSSPLPTLPSSYIPGQKRKQSEKRQTKLDFAPTTEGTQAAAQMPSPISLRGKSRKKGKDSNSSSEDEVLPSSQVQATPFRHLRNRRSKRGTLVEDLSSSSGNSEGGDNEQIIKANSLSDIGEPESSADEKLQSSPTHKRKRRPKDTINEDNSFIAPDSDDEEDEEPVRKSPKKRIQPGSSTWLGEDDQGEEEDVPIHTPARKRLRKAREVESSEREELRQELEDLRDSDVDTSSPVNRTGERARDARKASMALLMKRRGSKLVDSDGEEEDEDGSDGYEEGYEGIFRHQVETADDLEFIEEDDPDAEIGVPDMPLEFSKHASAKPGKLFGHVVEWMLQKHLNPAFKEKELHHFAFKRVGDEIQALVHSYMSSVWNEEFTFTLRARPEFFEHEISVVDRVLYPDCEACNRTNHPASFAIQFGKRAYDKKTLEEVESKSRDSEGRQIAKESKVFHLGAECARNARTAHPLVHWSYILYDHINEQWDAIRGLKMDKHWSTAKKTKKIEKFVDDMQASGQIKKLFIQFRNDVDVARQMKVEDW